MDPQPENENGSDPHFVLSDWRDLNNTSISELVSELRDSFLMSDFDRVEEALVAREAKLKTEIEEKQKEIGSLQEKLEVDRLDKLKAEFDKEKNKVQERCELLVKKEDNINSEQKCKRYDRDAVADIKRIFDSVSELKDKIFELEDEKKKWVDEKDDIGKLRAENCKLVEEKREAESMVEIWKRKFYELNERLLVNAGGNNERDSGVPFGGNDEKKMVEIDVGSAPLKRNEDFQLSTRKSPSIPNKNRPGSGASGGRLGMEMVIDVEDSDEDTCKTMDRKETTSGQKILPTGLAEPFGIRKRKFALSHEFETYINNLVSSDDDTKSSSSSSSSSGSFDLDSIPLSSLTSNKKMATEAANLRLNSSSRGK